MSFPFQILEKLITDGNIIFLAGFSIGKYHRATGLKNYVIIGDRSIEHEFNTAQDLCIFLESRLNRWFSSQELFIAFCKLDSLRF